MDGAVPGDDAVAERLVVGEAEVGGSMRDELVELDEAPRVAKQIDALARGELAGLVLAGHPLRAARFGGLAIQGLQLLQTRAHDGSPSRWCT